MPSGSLPSPIGHLFVEADGTWLTSLRIIQSVPIAVTDRSPLIDEALEQLRAWLAYGAHSFDLPLAPIASPRGQALREAITSIPAGETMSYGELAVCAVSSPRAIGQACARNPFPIIVPCHRVVQAGGKIGSYSAGAGPVTKQWMLCHEGRNLFSL